MLSVLAIGCCLSVGLQQFGGIWFQTEMACYELRNRPFCCAEQTVLECDMPCLAPCFMPFCAFGCPFCEVGALSQRHKLLPHRLPVSQCVPPVCFGETAAKAQPAFLAAQSLLMDLQAQRVQIAVSLSCLLLHAFG